MYKITILRSNALKLQTRIGIYGSDQFHNASYLDTWREIERVCRPLPCRVSKEGLYYRKKDAEITAKNLELYAFAGGMYLKAQTDVPFCLQICKIQKE